MGAALLLCASCGDDGDGGGSGVSESETVKDLPDDDAKALCMWLEDLVNGFQPSNEQLCEASVALQTSSQEECETGVPQCIMFIEMTGDDEPEDFDCDTATAADLGDCTATVGEVETCYRETVKLQESFFKGTTCEDAGKVSEPALPASCTVLKTKCPELAVDDEDDSSFTCDAGDTVLDESSVCDGVSDCTDGSDEQDC